MNYNETTKEKKNVLVQFYPETLCSPCRFRSVSEQASYLKKSNKGCVCCQFEL